MRVLSVTLLISTLWPSNPSLRIKPTQNGRQCLACAVTMYSHQDQCYHVMMKFRNDNNNCSTVIYTDIIRTVHVHAQFNGLC